MDSAAAYLHPCSDYNDYHFSPADYRSHDFAHHKGIGLVNSPDICLRFTVPDTVILRKRASRYRRRDLTEPVGEIDQKSGALLFIAHQIQCVEDFRKPLRCAHATALSVHSQDFPTPSSFRHSSGRSESRAGISARTMCGCSALQSDSTQ